MKRMYLDDEERDLVESIERGEWKSVKNLKAEIKKHQEYARNTLKKDKRVPPTISGPLASSGSLRQGSSG